MLQSFSKLIAVFMQIPYWPQSGEREAELLRDVLESPQWGGFHPFINEFEQSFAAYQQCPFGISAFNGTVTLELALSVLGIGPGDEVIVPAISFISTATSVARVGAIPVFVDIEEASFNIDPDRVLEAMTPRTRAVMTVHFGGVMADMAALQEICSSRGVFLIEDAAHAHGSEWKGRRAGSLGIAGSFSFQNGKVLSSGEGGILVTSDKAFADRARSFANCGRIEGESFYHHERLGTNFRLTALQAAVLIAQFERLNEQIETRTGNAGLLQRLVSDAPEVLWQQIPAEVTRNSYYLLTGRIRQGAKVSRDEFHHRLVESGVPCTSFYPHALYDNPVFQNGNCRVMPCPVSEARVKDAFWLPHRVLLADERTIHQVARRVERALSTTIPAAS